MPKVSIIVPNYNHSLFLEQRLKSIFDQTYQDYEVILLDDNSLDTSKEILFKYATHPKVSHFIVNEINSGSTFLQWKKGIDLASGKFIWIAESDDWCEPTLLETLIIRMDANINIVLGYVQSYYIVNNEIKWLSRQGKLENILNGKEFIIQNLLEGNAIFNASMAVFRKMYYESISNEYTSFKFCGDWLFWAELASQGDVFISGKVLNYFRNHSMDVSNKAYSTGLNFIEELKTIFIFLDKQYILENDFLQAIKAKYVRYREVRNIIDAKLVPSINDMFYNNFRTSKFKRKLICNFIGFKMKKKILNLYNFMFK